MTRRRTVVAVVAALLVLALAAVVAGLAVAAADDDVPVTQTALRLPVGPEPDGSPVTLDVSLFAASGGGRRPAVLLAHGFGGSKASVAAQARRLARAGYLAVTWSARGFGDSGGFVHLDDPDYEVADAARLLDLLAGSEDVALDSPGDPQVAVAGVSYGGALALMLAGTDRRVDAVAASITWHDLSQALVPQHAVVDAPDGGPGTPAAVVPVDDVGVFARAWAARFFAAALAAGDGAPSPCGGFAPDVCAAYLRLATRGVADADTLALLRRHSPAPVLADVRAPVLLMPGQSDSLFPLSQADASARALAAAGAPLKVAWLDGGHDGGVDAADVEARTLAWLRRWLPVAGDATSEGTGPDADDAAGQFVWSVPRPAADGGPVERRSDDYPGLPDGEGDALPAPTHRVTLAGGTQVVVSPPGGEPAAVTGVPGLDGALADGLAGGPGGAGAAGLGAGTAGPQGQLGGAGLGLLPGQSAVFTSAELDAPLQLLGAPRVSIEVTSSSRGATLFASLYDVGPGGRADLPRRLVAPLRLTGLTPGEPRQVTVSLPAVVLDVPAGHRLRLAVATTDAAYAVPEAPRVDRVALADPALVVPEPPADAIGPGSGATLPVTLLVVVAGVLLAAAATAVAAGVRRARVEGGAAVPADPEVPLVVSGLTKEYRSGLRAVDDVSFVVRRGQVVGLLGPNGAGKTTTLRMLMGLIHPSVGSITVLGRPVRPGASVLHRVGAFVEGPGFLPHRSGMANLRLYWEATGRAAAEAHIPEALQIAGLSDAVHRPVRTYSHGMRQRLGIAQAMLGLPDVLVLDEPTNGLDPPQIRAMRDVLRHYAAEGRTVLVSSHLLSEVEQTCSDVVVMDAGRVVAQGPVAELVAGGGRLRIEVDAPTVAAGALRGDGVGPVRTEEGAAGVLLVDARDVPVEEVVRRLVEAGVGVRRVAPARRLEEVFLDLVQEPAP